MSLAVATMSFATCSGNETRWLTDSVLLGEHVRRRFWSDSQAWYQHYVRKSNPSRSVVLSNSLPAAPRAHD
jgi:hypothetical protein